MYGVFEQVFNEIGYEFVPVTAQYRTVQECEREKAVLERRFREQELDTRFDWDHLDTTEPIRAKLAHLGQRDHDRLFAVRKVVVEA